MKITVHTTQEITVHNTVEVQMGTYCCTQANSAFKVNRDGNIGIALEKGGVFSFSGNNFPAISICPWCEEKIEREEILIEDENWMKRPKEEPKPEYWPDNFNDMTMDLINYYLNPPDGMEFNPLEEWQTSDVLNIMSEKEVRAGYKIRTVTEMNSYTLGKCILIMKKLGGSLLYQHVDYSGKTIHISDETKWINGG